MVRRPGGLHPGRGRRLPAAGQRPRPGGGRRLSEPQNGARRPFPDEGRRAGRRNFRPGPPGDQKTAEARPPQAGPGGHPPDDGRVTARRRGTAPHPGRSGGVPGPFRRRSLRHAGGGGEKPEPRLLRGGEHFGLGVQPVAMRRERPVPARGLLRRHRPVRQADFAGPPGWIFPERTGTSIRRQWRAPVATGCTSRWPTCESGRRRSSGRPPTGAARRRFPPSPAAAPRGRFIRWISSKTPGRSSDSSLHRQPAGHPDHRGVRRATGGLRPGHPR